MKTSFPINMKNRMEDYLEQHRVSWQDLPPGSQFYKMKKRESEQKIRNLLLRKRPATMGIKNEYGERINEQT